MRSLKLTNIGQLVTFNSGQDEMVVLENTEIGIEGNTIVEIGANLGDADQLIN